MINYVIKYIETKVGHGGRTAPTTYPNGNSAGPDSHKSFFCQDRFMFLPCRLSDE